MNIAKLTSAYDKLVARKALLLHDKNKKERIARITTKAIKNHEDTRDLLNRAIEIVHQTFKKELEQTITGAVKKVFGRDLEFELRHETKYNGIESRIIIKENGEEMSPEDDLGGSIIDIISFCFRIILWHMSSPKTRNVFILDEPFKWTGKLIEITGIILKQICQKYKIQLIIVTHEDQLINIADRVFLIDHNGIESKMRMVNNDK